MGLFNLFRKKVVTFSPNFKKTEYENWLDFLDCGGTSQEWEQIKTDNGWRFRESEEEKYERYLSEVKGVSDRYYKQMQEIQKDWSTLYNTGVYTGSLADNIERKCLANIADYKKMSIIDRKYGESTATNIPAFKRLAMLYEKQERFEEAIEICKQAYSFGMDERSRIARMIKKAKRNPTPDEIKLLGL